MIYYHILFITLLLHVILFYFIYFYLFIYSILKGGMSGIFSYNSKEAPLTYNWNKVYVPYCDGASFAGEVDDPTIVEINGKQHEVIF